MVENDIKDSESKGIDINLMVQFYNKLVVFQFALELAVELHLEFWRELLEENPNIQKLEGLGSKITNNLEIINNRFKKLTNMNSNHIKSLIIYGNFLKDIANSQTESQIMLEKAESIDKGSNFNKLSVDEEILKYGENSNTCIITTSCNLNSIGDIINSNDEITRLFGFTKSEVIGQNITIIIPKIFADNHDNLMKRYMETSVARIVGKERFFLAKNKSGYAVPSTLMVKILPNLDDGIKIVGFLKDVHNHPEDINPDFVSEEKVHYMLYGGENDVVHGLTYSCYQHFGIPSSLIYGNNISSNEFTIDIIFPDLDIQNQEELKSSNGLIITLDTTTLPENYLIADNFLSKYVHDEEGVNPER